MKILVILLTITIYALINPATILAAPIWDGYYGDCSYTCAPPAPNPSECWNGPSTSNTGNCGTVACGGGDNWSHYETKCKNFSPPGYDESCDYAWVKLGDVCSTANKCLDGETGLRTGQCDCGYGAMWKTCCSGTTPISCTQVDNDGLFPWEGTCAGGVQKDCGYDGHPPCGPEACTGGPTNTPGPTPTPGGPTDPPDPIDCPYTCLGEL